MIDSKKIKDLLPDAEKNNFDDIVLQRVLGASKHISMIGGMFVSIAEHGESVAEIKEKIISLADFFIETRGKASQAVTNAINIIIKEILKYDLEDVCELKKIAAKSYADYTNKAKDDINKIVNYGIELVKNMNSIMVFDYSSTVNSFLKGIKSSIEVFIPESRSIDGGHAFVKTCLDVGHKVHFIPDAAMMFVLNNCDAVFIGAETFYPDGTVFNTTGSDILAVLCQKFHVPYYVLTPLIKVDKRAVYGYSKEPVINDLKDRLAENWSIEEKSNVDFRCPELLGITSNLVTAYITENGIIPSNSIYSASLSYLKEF